MRLRQAARFGCMVVLLGVLAASCTKAGDGEQSNESSAPSSRSSTEVIADDPNPDAPAVSALDGPLGFDKEVFDIPIPDYDPSEGLRPILDSADLVEAGIEAGTWTEVEGVRAVISVITGELAVERLPSIDLVPHYSHHLVLEMAERLLAGGDLATDERADLERLTAFFFDEDFDSRTDAGVRRPSQDVSRFVSYQDEQVCLTGDINFYQPDGTKECYDKSENDAGDIVYSPVELPVEGAHLQAFEVIAKAREGYLELAESSLPPVTVRLIPRQNAAEDLAEAANFSNTRCRVTIFGAPESFDFDLDLQQVFAHELFHCIQGTWDGAADLDKFVEEGGAEYFSYRLIGSCKRILRWGPDLDAHTKSRSLLTSEYAGWFFWAFLDDYTTLDPPDIALLHRSIKEGASVTGTIGGSVENLPKVLHEFYVRLMGPGLACGFQGQHTTETKPVEKAESIELAADLWVGKRYELDYKMKRFFEQSDPGGGPIAMAKKDSRGSKESWVVTAEEVRTRCSGNEKWIVVVTSSTDAPEIRELDVDQVRQGACDGCLIGQWSVDVDTLVDFYAPPLGVSFGGSWTMQFQAGDGDSAPSQMTDQREIVINLAGASTPPRDANGAGTYYGDDKTLTVADFQESVEVSVGNYSSVFNSDAETPVLPYTCVGDNLVITRGPRILQATRNPASPEGEPYFD